MKSKLFYTLFIGLIFLVIGCTDDSKMNEEPLTNEDEPLANEGETSPFIPSVDVSDLEIEGRIEQIYYAHDNNLIISADKLYLFDTKKGQILNAVPKEDFQEEKFSIIDNGYVAVRNKINSQSGNIMMTDGDITTEAVFYNKNLETVSQFDFNQLFENSNTFLLLDGITFSSDGKQMAYATSLGLYLYNFDTGNNSRIIDLASEDLKARSGIINFEKVSFTEDNQRLAFKGQSFDIPVTENSVSFDTCGIVNTNGSILMNEKYSSFNCKRLTAYNDVLLYTEDPSAASGKTLVMDIPSTESKVYNLKDKKESGNVFGSNTGEYFATSVITETGWIVRIYNMETGELEAEQQISNEGVTRYMEHDPIIFVMDDTRTFFVLLGSKQDDMETKLIANPF